MFVDQNHILHRNTFGNCYDNFIPDSAASIIASGAKAGGTNIMVVFALSFLQHLKLC